MIKCWWINDKTSYESALSPLVHHLIMISDQLLHFYGVQSLKARRQKSDIMFSWKVLILRGFIDSSHHLGCFTIHIPPSLTSTSCSTMFHIPSCRVNTIASGVFTRIPRLVNRFLEVSPSSDILCDPSGRLKKNRSVCGVKPGFGVMRIVLWYLYRLGHDVFLSQSTSTVIGFCNLLVMTYRYKIHERAMETVIRRHGWEAG